MARPDGEGRAVSTESGEVEEEGREGEREAVTGRGEEGEGGEEGGEGKEGGEDGEKEGRGAEGRKGAGETLSIHLICHFYLLFGFLPTIKAALWPSLEVSKSVTFCNLDMN